jgi:hypothetical protein
MIALRLRAERLSPSLGSELSISLLSGFTVLDGSVLRIVLYRLVLDLADLEVDLMARTASSDGGGSAGGSGAAGGSRSAGSSAEVPRVRFRTTILRARQNATGVQVPAELVASLGTSKRPAVRVTINGHTYRSTVAVMGGVFMVGVSAENRASAGVAADDEVDVELALDTAPREVIVPADFAEALDRAPGARERFDSLSYSHKKAHVTPIEGAKTAETRQRRIAKAVSTLQEDAP